MAIEKINEGITGAEAADLLYANDLENAASATAAEVKANKVASDLAKVATFSKQIFDNNTMQSGNYSPANGGAQASANWIRTPLIPLDPSQSYISYSGAGGISTTSARACFYGIGGISDFISTTHTDTATQTSQTILIPESAVFVALSVANVVGIGNNPTTSPYAGTFMLNYGSILPFEKYGVYLDGSKIVGMQPELAKVVADVDGVTIPNKQLFDNATMMLKGNYTPAGLYQPTGVNWICTSKIPIDATQSKISINGAGPVQNTSARVLFWDAAGAFISSELSTGLTATQQSAVIPANAATVAFNVANVVGIGNNPTTSPYAGTVMVSYGDPATFEPYDPDTLYLDGSKIVNFPLPQNGNPAGFYQYFPTGYQGRPSFYIFSKYPDSPDLYARFQVSNFYSEDPVIYSNQYRIIGADQVKYINGVMSPTGKSLITSGESECVYLCSGRIDFTGGTHGDEQLIRVAFYADGVAVDTSAGAIALTPCGRFEYRQLSTTHETAGGTKENPIVNPAHPIEAHHAKATFFEGAKYGTFNTLTWARDAVPVTLWYHAISCISKDNGTFIENEYQDREQMVGDNLEKMQTIGARKYFATNAANRMGAQATSELLLPAPYLDNTGALINPDLLCLQFVWDRPIGDNKEYRRFNPLKPVVSGEKWASYMEVQFYAQD